LKRKPLPLAVPESSMTARLPIGVPEAVHCNCEVRAETRTGLLVFETCTRIEIGVGLIPSAVTVPLANERIGAAEAVLPTTRAITVSKTVRNPVPVRMENFLFL
jgi:hypothetical protein